MSITWSRSLPLSVETTHNGSVAVFDCREKAFETKYARDEELKFRVTARRNKLLGLWVAGKMGLGEREAADYARAVVFADLSRVGGRDVVAKVSADLKAKDLPVTDEQIQVALREFTALAEMQARVEA